LKKVALIATAVVAMLCMTAVAVGQYTLPVNVQMTGKVTPTKAGTKKKPKRSTLSFNVTVNKEARVTAREIVLFTPRNVKLNFTGFRFCPASQIAAEGVASCKKGSQLGTGAATAVLGPRQLPLNFSVRIFAGSKNELSLYLAQQGGTVTAALRGIISSAGAPFGQKVTIAVPNDLQQPAPGLFSSITGISGKVGGTASRKGKRYNAVSSNGCPRDRVHRFGVRLTFAPNPTAPSQATAEANAQSPCR
jgi:hypothetical protein